MSSIYDYIESLRYVQILEEHRDSKNLVNPPPHLQSDSTKGDADTLLANRVAIDMIG